MRRVSNIASRIVSMLLLISIALLPAYGRSHPPLPNPILFFVNAEPYTVKGKSLVRYYYKVLNSDAYPNSLFAAAPDLPPCGTNTKSSRTWVDLFDQRGKRLTGFCALGKNDDLNSIWFELPAEEIPPSYVYIEMTDRQTDTKYKSNLADTTL